MSKRDSSDTSHTDAIAEALQTPGKQYSFTSEDGSARVIVGTTGERLLPDEGGPDLSIPPEEGWLD